MTKNCFLDPFMAREGLRKGIKAKKVASHVSHANFAFNSKHPFQIALINCY